MLCIKPKFSDYRFIEIRLLSSDYRIRLRDDFDFVRVFSHQKRSMLIQDLLRISDIRVTVYPVHFRYDFFFFHDFTFQRFL